MVTQSLLHIILILWLSKPLAATSLAKPGCQETCGNVTIPYPFGIGAGCFIDDWFSITCNNSFNPPKPFLTSTNLEVLEIILQEGTVRVNNMIISSNCPNRKTGSVVNLRGSRFMFSDTKNRFTAMGCDNLALLNWKGSSIGGCLSICNANTNKMGCFGINCCQTRIPEILNYINITLGSIGSSKNDNEVCKSAFIVDQKWFNGSEIQAVQNMDYVPVVLQWGIFNGTCGVSSGMNPSMAKSSSTFCSTNAHCSGVKNVSNYMCFCDQGYQGNPYLPQGCQDINECAEPNGSPCEMFCSNTAGSYECSCPTGYVSYGSKCLMIADFAQKSRPKVVFLGSGIGVIGLLLLLIGAWWLYKVIKRRKETMRKEKFFKRNGGLLLQQQSSSSGEDNVEKTKLFTSKELEKATDHYNENRIIGQGGQGTVYKGMLTDGKIVAVKRSKIVDEGKLEQFINEVVIMSQINHRNVVKLLGCCLETEVPLLVYEFISNGTLFQYIHDDKNEEFSVSWEMHLRIATEVAGALSYLHSSASIPIYHRDIKSTNILLDDKYRAKLSDFGTSRSIAMDQTHLTTRVQGTFGYLDPEYFQSSQFTEKSDVYSFGVVLVELLTGQKPISSTSSQEKRSLATHFIFSMKENCLFDILDARVVKEGGKEEIMAVANLAKRCLNLNGKKRPAMKEVVMELEAIKRSSQGGFAVQQNYEELEYAESELNEPWDATSTSIGSNRDNSIASSLDIQRHDE